MSRQREGYQPKSVFGKKVVAPQGGTGEVQRPEPPPPQKPRGRVINEIDPPGVPKEPKPTKIIPDDVKDILGKTAFPVVFEDYAGTGMTLRDYFAGQALIGLWPHAARYESNPTPEKIASHCYRIADAMIKVRGEKNE